MAILPPNFFPNRDRSVSAKALVVVEDAPDVLPRLRVGRNPAIFLDRLDSGIVACESQLEITLITIEEES